jgi:excisionase family DNA binding protein
LPTLLTTKQVQEILKVDRITVYRMLTDGRLNGVKIGNQWRFHKKEIDRFIGIKESKLQEQPIEMDITEFPSHCVSKVEDLVAGIIGIGVTIVNRQGEPLTPISNCNPFCQLIRSSATGCKACQSSWREAVGASDGNSEFRICHAGLCFFRSVVKIDNQPVAWIISGQYRIGPPRPSEEQPLVKRLAETHRIPFEDLWESAHRIPVLDPLQQTQVELWSPRLATTVESILQERYQLSTRLQKISDLSAVRAAPAGQTLS